VHDASTTHANCQIDGHASPLPHSPPPPTQLCQPQRIRGIGSVRPRRHPTTTTQPCPLKGGSSGTNTRHPNTTLTVIITQTQEPHQRCQVALQRRLGAIMHLILMVCTPGESMGTLWNISALQDKGKEGIHWCCTQFLHTQHWQSFFLYCRCIMYIVCDII
jgi:hypothetical protein